MTKLDPQELCDFIQNQLQSQCGRRNQVSTQPQYVIIIIISSMSSYLHEHEYMFPALIHGIISAERQGLLSQLYFS